MNDDDVMGEIADLQQAQLVEGINEDEARWDDLFRAGPEPLFEPPTEGRRGDWWWAA